MCMSILSAYVSVHHVQERALDPLKLEVQKVISHCVGAGNFTGVLKKQPVFLTTELFFQLLP